MVDWPRTLWPASYKGVPFWTLDSSVAARRRVVAHEFPMRDDPYLEDLGLATSTVEVTAYVASDTALVEAAALVGALASAGAGPLVLPDMGPIPARCTEWKRSHARDEQGKIAFTATFMREGSLVAMAGLGLAAALVESAADAVAQAAEGIGAGLTVAGLPGFVADGAAAGVQDAVVTLEALRDSSAVTADASAEARDALAVLYADAPALAAAGGAGIGSALVAAARTLADGMAAADAASAFGALADAPAPTPLAAGTAAALALSANAGRVDRMARCAALAAYAEALVRATYGSRQEGVAARAAAAVRFETAIADLGGGDNAAALLAMLALRDRTIDWISRVVTDLAPVVTVSAAASLPSLWWAWRLYADPTRAAELVARNRVAQPSFMPERFEALAS